MGIRSQPCAQTVAELIVIRQQPDTRPAKPYNGLGFRSVQAKSGGKDWPITEWPVIKA